MTGFLTQLAARGLGQVDVARPRPVSRFEPSGPSSASPLAPPTTSDTDGIDMAAEETRPAPPSNRQRSPRGAALAFTDEPSDGEAPRSTSRRATAAAPTATGQVSVAPTVTPSTPPAPTVSVMVRESGARHVGDEPPGLPAIRPLTEATPSATASSAPGVAPLSPVPTPPASHTRAERIVVQPEVRPLAERPTPPSSALSLPPTSSGPTVHVTIGRLEVRATPPPPPARTTRPTEPSPPVKLDDYLRRRGGRGTP